MSTHEVMEPRMCEHSPCSSAMYATRMPINASVGVYGSHGQKRDERCARKAPMSKEAIGAASSTAPPV